LNARSKASSSSAPASWAVSMNRFDCSGSSGFGAGLRPIMQYCHQSKEKATDEA